MSKELISQNSKEMTDKLGDRWGCGKATIYKRLEFLGIAISKADGKSFLNSNDLVQLDQLNEWMSNGNTLACITHE